MFPLVEPVKMLSVYDVVSILEENNTINVYVVRLRLERLIEILVKHGNKMG